MFSISGSRIAHLQQQRLDHWLKGERYRLCNNMSNKNDDIKVGDKVSWNWGRGHPEGEVSPTRRLSTYVSSACLKIERGTAFLKDADVGSQSGASHTINTKAEYISNLSLSCPLFAGSGGLHGARDYRKQGQADQSEFH